MAGKALEKKGSEPGECPHKHSKSLEGGVFGQEMRREFLYLWPILRCPWRGTPTWHRPVSLGGPLHWCPQSRRCAWGPRNFPASFRKLPAWSCCAHQRDLRTDRKALTWSRGNSCSLNHYFLYVQCPSAPASSPTPEWSHEGRWMLSQRKLCCDANSKHRLSLLTT